MVGYGILGYRRSRTFARSLSLALVVQEWRKMETSIRDTNKEINAKQSEVRVGHVDRTGDRVCLTGRRVG